MTLVNRAAIFIPGGSILTYLPPFDLQFRAQEINRLELEPIPYHANNVDGLGVTSNRVDGIALSLSGVYRGTSAADSILWKQTVREGLFASGQSAFVEICGWYDTDEALKETYQRCLVRSFTVDPEAGTIKRARWTLEAVSLRPVPYVSFSDGNGPAEGPYENYLTTDGTVGTVTPPSGSVTINTVAPLYKLSGVLWGTVQDTVAANVGFMQWRARVPADGTVRKLIVTQASPRAAGSGTTTIECSTTDYQTQDAAMQTTVAAGSTYGTESGDSFSVSAGDYIYVYVPTGGAGAHGDIGFLVEVEHDSA